MKAILLRILMLFAAASMAVMASSYFFYSENPFLDAKKLSSELWYLVVFKGHISFGIVAVISGAINFFKLPSKSHRKVGMLYVTSIFVSASFGIVAAQFATGGTITRFGFTLLALLWFYTTWMAFTKAKAREIQQHRQWIYRSYALTISSLTLRLFLLAALFGLAPFIQVYQFASWGCWITNLFFCELILFKKRKTWNLGSATYT